MTALLIRLTRLELIYRSPDPKDGRIKLVGLIAKGFKLIDKAIESRFNEARESIKFLSKTEKIELSTLLKKLLMSLDL